MAGFHVLDPETATLVESVCDAIVPGSARVRPAVYIDALLARMDDATRTAVLRDFATLADGDLAEHAGTPELPPRSGTCDRGVLQRLRGAGRGRNRSMGRDRLQHAARDSPREGLVVPRHFMTERFDIVVVGSGAGGGVIAGELAERGRKVLLLETGPHRTAADFTRWEAKASHDIWWPIRFALIDGGAGGAVALLGGRCVGGTTTINTKVALRADAQDFAKWHEASGIVGSSGAPFGSTDLDPHYDRVERRLGVRERTDWRKSLLILEPAFRELGAPLEPVRSYTDVNCMSCGSCLQGCPTNAGKSTLNTYIHDAWATGKLELRADAHVERVLIEDGEARGVEYVDSEGAHEGSMPGRSSWPPER